MSHFIEMPVPSHESERSCICVLGVDVFLSTIFLLDFWTVPTEWYFSFFILSICIIILATNECQVKVFRCAYSVWKSTYTCFFPYHIQGRYLSYHGRRVSGITFIRYVSGITFIRYVSGITFIRYAQNRKIGMQKLSCLTVFFYISWSQANTLI